MGQPGLLWGNWGYYEATGATVQNWGYRVKWNIFHGRIARYSAWTDRSLRLLGFAALAFARGTGTTAQRCGSLGEIDFAMNGSSGGAWFLVVGCQTGAPPCGAAHVRAGLYARRERPPRAREGVVSFHGGVAGGCGLLVGGARVRIALRRPLCRQGPPLLCSIAL